MGILACILQLVTAIILIIPNMSFAATFFAFYLAGTAYIVNPLLFGWANVICQRGGDDALRSVVLYSMNASSSILYTFWGIAFYSAADVPYWRTGSITMMVVIVFLLAMLGVVSWLDRYTLAKQELELEINGIPVEVRLEDMSPPKYKDTKEPVTGESIGLDIKSVGRA